jgi:outer membrane protein
MHTATNSAPRLLAPSALAMTVLVVLGFMMIAPVAGADAATRTITFDEAVHIALARNLTLLLAANQRDVNDVAVSDARWRFFPDLRLGVSGSRSLEKTTGEAGQTKWPGTSSLSANLSSSLTLFDGLGNVASLREARFEQAAGELDYERARQTVVFQVITDYLAFIEATEQDRVQRENLAAEEEQIAKVRALVEEGERPINELYQQEANVAAARLGLVEADRTLELSRVDLVQILQLDPLADIDFAIPPATTLEPDTAAGAVDLNIPFETLAATASQQRADLAAERNRVAASGARLDAAQADWWPTLSLSAGLSGRYSDQLDQDVFSQLDDRQSLGLSLSLSFPIFDRLQTRNTVRRAEIGRDNAEISLTGLDQDVALQVRRAVLDRDAARESLTAATARAAAAREALTYTNERYLAGASTLFEVSLARADLVSAESGEVSARYRLLWQNRLVEYYVGTLDPDTGLGY